MCGLKENEALWSGARGPRDNGSGASMSAGPEGTEAGVTYGPLFYCSGPWQECFQYQRAASVRDGAPGHTPEVAPSSLDQTNGTFFTSFVTSPLRSLSSTLSPWPFIYLFTFLESYNVILGRVFFFFFPPARLTGRL